MFSSDSQLVAAKKTNDGWVVFWEPDGTEFPKEIGYDSPGVPGKIRRVGGEEQKDFIAGLYRIPVSDDEIEVYQTEVDLLWGNASDALAAIAGQVSDKMTAVAAAVEKLNRVIESFDAKEQRTVDGMTLMATNKEAMDDIKSKQEVGKEKIFGGIRSQQMGENWNERVADPDQGQILPSRRLPEPNIEVRGLRNKEGKGGKFPWKAIIG